MEKNNKIIFLNFLLLAIFFIGILPKNCFCMAKLTKRKTNKLSKSKNFEYKPLTFELEDEIDLALAYQIIDNKYENKLIELENKLFFREKIDANYIKKVCLNKKNKMAISLIDEDKTPLIVATILGDINVVKLLLKYKDKNNIDIDETGNFDDTAILWACIEQKEEIFNLLFDNGADINKKSIYEQYYYEQDPYSQDQNSQDQNHDPKELKKNIVILKERYPQDCPIKIVCKEWANINVFLKLLNKTDIAPKLLLQTANLNRNTLISNKILEMYPFLKNL